MSRLAATEFSGDDAEFQPESKGGVLSGYEKTRQIYRSDAMDEAAVAEIVTERVV